VVTFGARAAAVSLAMLFWLAPVVAACGPTPAYRPGPAWRLPWDAPDGVARATGRDGRVYGPQA
jgi:hypothetical protein